MAIAQDRETVLVVNARCEHARFDGIAAPEMNLVSRAKLIVRRTFSASHSVIAVLGA